MNKPFIIAEIGCNHMGRMDLARKFIRIAKDYCQADAVKFQTRDIPTWAEKYPAMYNAPHPNPRNAYGPTYRAHREALEFDLEQNRELKAYCEEQGIIYSTSVWDLPSAQRIASLQPRFIKIPSACNTNLEMLSWLCDNYSGEIQISTGMTTHDEIQTMIDLFVKKGRNKDLILYSCTSGYPVPYEDVCLLEIRTLEEKYGDVVKEIGFSGHHLGTAVDIAAYTLGATYIERHFTLNKNWKGTDHAASLEPEEMKRLVTDLNAVHAALQYKKQEVLDIEEVQRKKLKW
ncbi:MAG: N-acetylneuraminate synthase family protein [Anaerovoracaceae bacterium]